MRLTSICLLIAAVLLSLPASAEVLDPARVEKVLRENGLSPRSRPTWEEKFAIGVLGAQQKPEFVVWSCARPEKGRKIFQGKRFTYEADNHGEFGGALNVHEGGGPKRSIVGGNVIDLITYKDDLYVFTGLDHMGMSSGAVQIVEDYDRNPSSRHLTQTPEAPAVVILDRNWGGFLIVSSLSVSVVTLQGSLHVIMARHAFLPTPNSVMSMGEADILVGVCGGVAWIHAPWRMHFPPDRDPVAEAANNIPLVTYWTRQ